ncbi:cell division protein FtsQ/DivIB [candidate division KSB1 bacterium]|nr:cell division protein FtsQ/DivIB [candidate division KSB1 bacterium]
MEKADKIGRIAAVLSTVVLGALLFNIWVLNATTLEKPAASLRASDMNVPEEHKISWMKKVYDALVPTALTAPVSPAELDAELVSTPRAGKPVAYVNIGKLYLISKSGKIIGAADSCRHYDVPIISSDSFLINEAGTHLVDEGTINALQLLAALEKNYSSHLLLSELKIKEKNIIAYMNLGRVLPVIFGQGSWDDKIANLTSYREQLGASELTQRALYLDLRVKDKIIVKKNV